MTDSIPLKIGLDAISSYKRLAYTPWHAIAEFVDNSTQSYFDHKSDLDKPYSREDEGMLLVSIVYDKDQAGGFLRVTDNAMGMSLQELTNAMHVSLRPPDTSGRSKYGMGMKTAACWIGNVWTVRTKKLGETKEHTVKVDVAKVASGEGDLPYKSVGNKSKGTHYTIIEITKHNRRFQGRTLGKIRDFLRSMYRQDFRNKVLRLEWQHEVLEWIEPELLEATDGSTFRKEFKFKVGGKSVSGWVGILAKGGRADAGFSILHCGRVVRGWPDSWRPSSLYGQFQGSNDLVNQRLVGEVSLDEFEVSHTKDDILWLGNEEDDVEKKLLKYCGDYRDTAKTYRKKGTDERGPTEVEVDVAVEELQTELASDEMIDAIEIEVVPSEQVVKRATQTLIKSITKSRPETLRAKIAVNKNAPLLVKVYIAGDMSPNDPYVVEESSKDSEIIVIVNTEHPHWTELKASEGVANYLRHCIYDAIAEWQALKLRASLDPNTIKLLKDRLLRVSLEMEKHEP